MYVDESGDTGTNGSPTDYFALSGLTVHESRWRELLERLVSFRRAMKVVYGLPLRTEIHASEYIRHPPVDHIKKHERLAILRNCLDELSKIDYLSITNVVIQKNGKPEDYDVFVNAWRTLFQRFENTIQYGNFPGNYKNDSGLIIVDNTDGRKLQRLVRKMAVYNPIPGMGGAAPRDIPIVRVIEDPHHKNSIDSYFVQSCDVCAYFLKQKFAPSKYITRQGAKNYFDRLDKALNKRASHLHPQGIVIL